MVMNHHCMIKITYQSFQSVTDELFGSEQAHEYSYRGR